MLYVDGFIVDVPTSNRDKYQKHAIRTAVVFREYGALKMMEC